MNLRRPQNPVVAASNGESAVMQKLLTAFEKSKRCFPSAFTLILEIAPNSSQIADTRIDSKGDFLCEFVTGKMWAQDVSTGALVPSVTTGVSFNVNESGNNRDLFLAPIAAETLLTPGYGSTIFEKWNLRDYIFKSTATVKVSAQNSNPTYKQFLELTFVGFQFIGSMR